MSERPSRPILHLKGARVITPTAAPAPAVAGWRCKPCGATANIEARLEDDDEVRCPACGALLGRAGQFRSDPPQLQRIRARRVGT
jgi:hypothetical protein